MSTEQAKAYLTEVKGEAEHYLGRRITKPEWEKALLQATRKLAFIIEREETQTENALIHTTSENW